MDRPAGQWIRELRLYKAQWLIQRGRVNTLEELAQRVGFKNPPYFRKIYGSFFDTNLSAHFNNNNLKKRLHDRM